MAVIQDHMVGGAEVKRGFTRGGEYVKPGATLTRRDLLAMPRPNLQALVDTGKLQLFPPTPGLLGEPGELHLINRGFGRYDVIEGRILTDEPFQSKEAAEAFIAETRAKAGLPGEEPAQESGTTPAPN